MKILVTGSSGTIGTRLCEKLLEAGRDVAGVDWKPNRWHKHIDERTIQADLREEGALDAIPKEIDLIVHLAANARVYELVEHPDRARDNLLTLFNVLEFARRNKVTKCIFASSREGYGNIDEETLREDMVRVENCESPYTASKVGGEALLHAYRGCYGLQCIILRYSNVYGMYDDSVRVVPQFIRQARMGAPMTVFGKEKCLDFTYIDDAVEGTIRAIENFDEAKNDTYNIAYGEGTTIVHLAEQIKKRTKSSSEILIDKARTGEVIRYVADIGKAKKQLGFKPQISFDKGIEKTVAWYSEHL